MGKAKGRQDKSKVSILLLPETMKKGGLKGPFLMTRFFPSRKADCLTSAKKLAFHTIAA
jgi:hypothetical protein